MMFITCQILRPSRYPSQSSPFVPCPTSLPMVAIRLDRGGLGAIHDTNFRHCRSISDLFFGNTANAILKNWRGPVLFIAS